MSLFQDFLKFSEPEAYQRGMQNAQTIQANQIKLDQANADGVLDRLASFGLLRADGSFDADAHTAMMQTDMKTWHDISVDMLKNSTEAKNMDINWNSLQLSMEAKDQQGNVVANFGLTDQIDGMTPKSYIKKLKEEGNNVYSVFSIEGFNPDGSQAIITDKASKDPNDNVTFFSLSELNKNLDNALKEINATSSRPVLQVNFLRRNAERLRNEGKDAAADLNEQQANAIESRQGQVNEISALKTYLQNSGNNEAARMITALQTNLNISEEAREGQLNLIRKQIRDDIENEKEILVAESNDITKALEYFSSTAADMHATSANLEKALKDERITPKVADFPNWLTTEFYHNPNSEKGVTARVNYTAGLIANAAPNDPAVIEYTNASKNLQGFMSRDMLIKEAVEGGPNEKSVRSYVRLENTVAQTETSINELQEDLKNLDMSQQKRSRINKKIRNLNKSLERDRTKLQQAKENVIGEYMQVGKETGDFDNVDNPQFLEYTALLDQRDKAALKIINRARITDFTKDGTDPEVLLQGFLDGSYKFDSMDAESVRENLSNLNIASLEEASQKLDRADKLNLLASMLYSSGDAATQREIFTQGLDLLNLKPPSLSEDLAQFAENFKNTGTTIQEFSENKGRIYQALSTSTDPSEINEIATELRYINESIDNGLKVNANNAGGQAFWQEEERKIQSQIVRTLMVKELYRGLFSTNYPGGRLGGVEQLSASGDETSNIKILKDGRLQLLDPNGKRIGDPITQRALIARGKFTKGGLQRFMTAVKANKHNQG